MKNSILLALALLAATPLVHANVEQTVAKKTAEDEVQLQPFAKMLGRHTADRLPGGYALIGLGLVGVIASRRRSVR
ncbi:hypothetical protein ACTSKR_07930 [Chitinibacteraceae bacterium HSL-7]